MFLGRMISYFCGFYFFLQFLFIWWVFQKISSDNGGGVNVVLFVFPPNKVMKWFLFTDINKINKMIGSTLACLDCLMCQPAVPPHRLHQVRPHSKRKRVRDNNIFTIPVNFLLLLHMSYMCHKVDRCLGKTACAPKPIDQPMYHNHLIPKIRSPITISAIYYSPWSWYSWWYIWWYICWYICWYMWWYICWYIWWYIWQFNQTPSSPSFNIQNQRAWKNPTPTPWGKEREC